MTIDPGQDPYAAPITTAPPPPTAAEPMDEAERERRANITLETGIKGLGVLMLLAGLGNLGFFLYYATLLDAANQSGRGGGLLVLMGGTLACAVLHLIGAPQLWRLRHTGRVLVTVGVVLSVGMGGITAGNSGQHAVGFLGRLILPIIILLTLWQANTETLFSARYREQIIPATPQVRIQMSALAWVAVCAGVGFVAAMLVGRMLRS